MNSDLDLRNSPVSPLTSLIPLVFVISVTAAKQGYEDFLRHRADTMVNYSYVTVIRNGVEQDVKCQEIVQGDIVMAVKDCDVPCDLVLIKSSDPNLKCHITTANLDGETNLKTLMVPKGLPNVDIEKLHTLGTIECEQSTTDLYKFKGRIELGPIYRKERDSVITDFNERRHALPLMAENLLLRGSRIKNTEWAIGCAVYTDNEMADMLANEETEHKTTETIPLTYSDAINALISSRAILW
ncbi:Phospholipid-transporting ATPase IH [Pseudolycoriella hygida]|uniref:Phospholipid-transporting ATPase IH n=1 Tax=Pseudolycoriella hygida TaxID=35572 RepID=A0A9Q0MZ28_9DIPT|nr:Phospholipid-transporting ATPase IH [Pseudolycoriella hygida]